MSIQVFLYDEEARCYRIYVLFKDLWTKGIENGDVCETSGYLEEMQWLFSSIFMGCH